MVFRSWFNTYNSIGPRATDIHYFLSMLNFRIHMVYSCYMYEVRYICIFIVLRLFVVIRNQQNKRSVILLKYTMNNGLNKKHIIRLCLF